MLSKYAVQLLVAVTYVLALPRDNNVGDLKLLKLGSVDASQSPHPPQHESLVLATHKALEKRRDIPENKNNIPGRKNEKTAPNRHDPTTTPNRNAISSASGSQGKQTCPNDRCAKCTNPLKPMAPLPIPANLGEIPKGYFKKVSKNPSRPGKFISMRVQLPKDDVKTSANDLPGRSGPHKRLEHQANCKIRYQIPAAPQEREWHSWQSPGTNKWWTSREYVYRHFEEQVCTQQFERHNRPSTGYELVYAYEPWLIKMFINAASLKQHPREEDVLVVDCSRVTQVFDTRSNDRRSRFYRITPAQSLANELACSGDGCPTQGRTTEFFILKDRISHMKQIMMSGRRLREKEQLAGEDERVAWDSSFDRTRDIMTNIGLAFDFYRQPEVIAAFRHANERIRSVLDALDKDPFYKGLKGVPADHSWREAYDDWVAMHLRKVEDNVDDWLLDASNFVVEEEEKLPEAQRLQIVAWRYFQFGHEQGLLRVNKVRFPEEYAEIFERAPRYTDAALGREPFNRPETPVFRKRQNDSPVGNKKKTTPSHNGLKTASGRQDKQTCSKDECATCKLIPIKSIPGLTNPNDTPSTSTEHAGTKRVGQHPTKKVSEQSGLRKRDEQANCWIRYRLPEVMSVEAAASNPAVSKWWFSEEYSIADVCGWELIQDAEHSDISNFQVTHAYEPGFIKLFLSFITLHRTKDGKVTEGGEPVYSADCSVVPRVFNTLSHAPGSVFSHTTPAQALANEVSMIDISTSTRYRQAYLLEYAPSIVKMMILNGRSAFHEQDEERTTLQKLQSLMVNIALAFEFFNQGPILGEDSPASVAASFLHVNDRVRQVLKAVDSDPGYAKLRLPSHPSWLTLYDTWLKHHLKFSEKKTQHWLNQAENLIRQKASSPSASSSDKQALAWVEFHTRDRRGMFLQGNIKFGPSYDRVLGRHSEI